MIVRSNPCGESTSLKRSIANSTVGGAKAKAVLHARIFDTTILSWDLAKSCELPHYIDDEQASYVLTIAEVLVPNVRSRSAARYKERVEAAEDAALVDRLVAVTGRDPAWSAPPR